MFSPEPSHVPPVRTPFLRYSSGVGSRRRFARTRSKWDAITAQVSPETALAASPLEEGAPAGDARGHGSSRMYSDAVRQTRPEIGSDSAGCSEDHFCPMVTPPAGAPDPASSCAIHARAASRDFSSEAIPSRPVVEITLPPASRVNSRTFPSSLLYCNSKAVASGSKVSLRISALDFSYVVRSRMAPGALEGAGRTSSLISASQVMTRFEGPCGSEARPERDAAVVVSKT